MNSIQAETKRFVSMINSARSRTTAHGIAQSVAGRIAAAAIAEREFKLGLEAVYTAYELDGVNFSDTRAEALERKRAILGRLEAASSKPTLAPACAGGSLPSQVPQTLKNDSGHLPATGSVISPAAAVQSKPAAPATSTKTLRLICARIFKDRPLPSDSGTEAQQRAAYATIIWQGRGAYPGCEADFSTIPAGTRRDVADAKFNGMERAAVATNQAMISLVLSGKLK